MVLLVCTPEQRCSPMHMCIRGGAWCRRVRGARLLCVQGPHAHSVDVQCERERERAYSVPASRLIVVQPHPSMRHSAQSNLARCLLGLGSQCPHASQGAIWPGAAAGQIRSLADRLILSRTHFRSDLPEAAGWEVAVLATGKLSPCPRQWLTQAALQGLQLSPLIPSHSSSFLGGTRSLSLPPACLL